MNEVVHKTDKALKRCKYCGAEAELVHNQSGFDNLSAYIRCQSCWAQTRIVKADANYCADDKVIELWNMSAAPANNTVGAEWIPTSNPPKNDDFVWVYTTSKHRGIGFIKDGEWKLILLQNYCGEAVLYWSPIPPDPKE